MTSKELPLYHKHTKSGYGSMVFRIVQNIFSLTKFVSASFVDVDVGHFDVMYPCCLHLLHFIWLEYLTQQLLAR